MQSAMWIFEKNETAETSFFSDCFQTFNGGIFESNYYVPSSDNKLITIKNIDEDGFNSEDVSFLSDDKAEIKYKLVIGDILLTMTGNIGRVGIVDENQCFLNQRVLKIKSVSKLYLLCFLTKYKAEIVQLGKGTAQMNLSLEDLNKLAIHNSKQEIEYFQKYDVLFDRILNLKVQNKVLKQQKQLLLNKFFTA